VAFQGFEAKARRLVRAGSERETGVDNDAEAAKWSRIVAPFGTNEMRAPISMGFKYSCANATQSRVSAGLISPPKRD